MVLVILIPTNSKFIRKNIVWIKEKFPLFRGQFTDVYDQPLVSAILIRITFDRQDELFIATYFQITSSAFLFGARLYWYFGYPIIMPYMDLKPSGSPNCFIREGELSRAI